MMNRFQALELLEWGEKQNPGPWRAHSLTAARAAEAIANACGMDAERAFVFGALHDIGRYEGVRGLHHAIAGYELMTRKGESEIARICITHSFPRMRVDDAASELDMTDGELEFMKNFLSTRPADDYDRLIQLCDSISLPEGVCLMEKRLVDVALRHGVGGNTIEKWKAFLSLRDEFSNRAGGSIYRLFSEAIMVTFGN